MQNNQKDLSLAILYFLLSTVITALFIVEKYALYENWSQMALSGSIAGTKWGIQLVVALLFMGRKKYEFIRRIGFVAMVGSIILLSVFLLSCFPISDNYQFIIPLIASVATMLVLYYYAVKRSGVSLRWYFGWIFCLIIAISLQLTIVFHII